MAGRMVPAGWTGRQVRLEYVGPAGDGRLPFVGLASRHASGKLLDVMGVGPVLGIGGARTLFPWESVVLMELVED